eukprot:8930985-Lingulodinium_polyedra.AAC.1
MASKLHGRSDVQEGIGVASVRWRAQMVAWALRRGACRLGRLSMEFSDAAQCPGVLSFGARGILRVATRECHCQVVASRKAR